jgi:hypothetical protein
LQLRHDLYITGNVVGMYFIVATEFIQIKLEGSLHSVRWIYLKLYISFIEMRVTNILNRAPIGGAWLSSALVGEGN